MTALTTMTPLIRRAGHGLLVALLAAASALLLAVVIVPLVLGWVPLTVLSGSMEPAVPTGSQVVVEPLEGEQDVARLGVGDVVTFMPRPGDATLVTHRIVQVAHDGEGRRSFTTRGDANAAPDQEVLTATQLRGVVRYHVPWAGYAANVLDPGQKRGGIVLAAAALIGYALWQVLGVLRDRRRRTGAEAGPPPGPPSGLLNGPPGETLNGPPGEPPTEPLPVVAVADHDG
jgi:signal peptidase I